MKILSRVICVLVGVCCAIIATACLWGAAVLLGGGQ
jgi:hypothetical protein